MNPLALDLNEQLSKSNPEIADMLSDLGKLMYYPKGILSQSAEAKATKYNATIGMATYKDSKMYAETLNDMFNHLEPNKYNNTKKLYHNLQKRKLLSIMPQIVWQHIKIVKCMLKR